MTEVKGHQNLDLTNEIAEDALHYLFTRGYRRVDLRQLHFLRWKDGIDVEYASETLKDIVRFVIVRLEQPKAGQGNASLLKALEEARPILSNFAGDSPENERVYNLVLDAIASQKDQK